MSQTIQTSDTPRNRDLNSIQFTEKPEKFDKFKLLNNQNLNNIFNSERDIENNSKRASDADKNKFDFSIKKNTINLNFKSPFCKNQISAKKETIFNLNNKSLDKIKNVDFVNFNNDEFNETNIYKKKLELRKNLFNFRL